MQIVVMNVSSLPRSEAEASFLGNHFSGITEAQALNRACGSPRGLPPGHRWVRMKGSKVPSGASAAWGLQRAVPAARGISHEDQGRVWILPGDSVPTVTELPAAAIPVVMMRHLDAASTYLKYEVRDALRGHIGSSLEWLPGVSNVAYALPDKREYVQDLHARVTDLCGASSMLVVDLDQQKAAEAAEQVRENLSQEVAEFADEVRELLVKQADAAKGIGRGVYAPTKGKAWDRFMELKARASRLQTAFQFKQFALNTSVSELNTFLNKLGRA